MNHDLDYVAARLHGRRSTMAEADRLDSLCRIRSVAELARALYPDDKISSIAELQQRLTEDLAQEISWLADYLPEKPARLLDWILMRLQLENLKVLIRGLASQRALNEIQAFLVRVPKPLELDATQLARARSLEELIQLLPQGVFRKTLLASFAQARTQPFFIEAALDCVYFRELLERVGYLPGPDQEIVKPVVAQEIDIFHLMLVVRGKFIYGLSTDLLLPLHIEGTQLTEPLFAAMLGDRELAVAAARANGRVFNSGAPPTDPAALEFLGWRRFLRLANQAFRRDPTGLGTIFGYMGLRRIEVANLFTISEGIRAGLSSERIRARLIGLEGPNV